MGCAPHTSAREIAGLRGTAQSVELAAALEAARRPVFAFAIFALSGHREAGLAPHEGTRSERISMTGVNNAPPVHANSGMRRGQALVARLAATGIMLVVWFWTQSLIGKRSLPASGI